MAIIRFFGHVLIGLLLTTGVVDAQGNNELPKNHPLYDGKLDEFEVELAKRTAVEDLKKVQETMMNELTEMLSENGSFSPMAVMMLNSGEVKPLKLEGEAKNAPNPLAVTMYRSALRSSARHQQIMAASIVYPAKSEEESSLSALVFEFEHRLGVSAIRLLPYKHENGDLAFGEAKQKDKPYQLFYDPKKNP